MDGHAFDEKQDPESPWTPNIDHSVAIRPQARKLHDPDVTFEEYYYYAQKTREEEERVESPKVNWRALLDRKMKSNNGVSESGGEPKQINLNLAKEDNRLLISDEEWTNASRSFRTASWGAVFYLVRFLSIPQLRLQCARTSHSLDHYRHPRAIRRPLRDWNSGVWAGYRALHCLRLLCGLQWLPNLARLHGRRLPRISSQKLR